MCAALKGATIILTLISQNVNMQTYKKPRLCSEFVITMILHVYIGTLYMRSYFQKHLCMYTFTENVQLVCY